jgi:hypothetical protein
VSKVVILDKPKRSKFGRRVKVKTVEMMTWEEFEKIRCMHCGGGHLRACPRIKRMLFATNGNLAEIEFFRYDEFDQTGVVWPEDVVREEEDNEQESNP